MAHSLPLPRRAGPTRWLVALSGLAVAFALGFGAAGPGVTAADNSRPVLLEGRYGPQTVVWSVQPAQDERL